MILLKELSRVHFRDDILRGVRLFAIAFAGILLCVAAYRMLRSPFEAQGAPRDTLAAPQPPQPSPPETSPDAAQVLDTSAEPHPLVVPPPPPVGGTPAPVVRRVVRPRNQSVPPPPPVARAKRPPAPSGREFESTQVGGVLPSAPGDESSEASPGPANKAVGYKSLIEANPNRPPPEPAGEAAPEESRDTSAKGNRFLKAVGKIFHVGGKKDTTPSALQPKQPE